jgi:hypothetical protein
MIKSREKANGTDPERSSEKDAIFLNWLFMTGIIIFAAEAALAS